MDAAAVINLALGAWFALNGLIGLTKTVIDHVSAPTAQVERAEPAVAPSPFAPHNEDF